MFISCESYLNSESGTSGGIDSDFSFPSIFLENRMIMVISDSEPKDVRVATSMFTTDDYLTSKSQQITFSYSGGEE